eukprot:CAMPEP_0116935996 /NCGR_PEP_ID=MMETSP0467-20121206/30618_1 /TAXON_ID=283647 /ORGANISM="Mesodinium pulex, Strain SPMC105" /LENGTH=107 /DNA_ID=CAMNT_0004617481 /DNA_START=419 /DNA_END=742 /DNA_ORIENTATION=+
MVNKQINNLKEMKDRDQLYSSPIQIKADKFDIDIDTDADADALNYTSVQNKSTIKKKDYLGNMNSMNKVLSDVTWKMNNNTNKNCLNTEQKQTGSKRNISGKSAKSE